MLRPRPIHAVIQIIRRSVQVAVMLLVVGLVMLSLYAHYRAARGLDDPELTAGWMGSVLIKIDDQVSKMDSPEQFLDSFKGTLWSMTLAGLDLTDPLAAAESAAASKTIDWRLVRSIAIPLIVALLLGKVFCSWICPANLLLELTGKLRKLLRFAEITPGRVEFSRKNKYVLLAAGLVVAAVVHLPLFFWVYPPAVLSRMVHAWVFGTAMTGMVIVMLLIVLFELFVSPRWWCRTMCPGGALYGLVGWPRLLRVRYRPSRCTNCGHCKSVCEPGLDPVSESEGIDCDNCGECIRHCPERAMNYTIALPGRRRARSKKLTAVKTSLILLTLMPLSADAHHILGLPHYSYKENYPQAPTLEYPATTGPYDILLTSYPGKPIPGEPTNLAFYVKNRTTGTPYDRPITVRVLQTFTFGRNRECVAPTVVEPFEQPHKLSVTFPENGEYIVELTIAVEGKPEVIPFMMIAGEPSATLSIVISIGAGLAIFIIVVRAIKIKRRRRAQSTSEEAP